VKISSWRVLCVLTAFCARAAAQTEPAEISVEGERRHPQEPPLDPYVAGSVVRGESLAAPGLQASDVMRSQTGVQVAELGGYGAPATASIRGATSAQTPVYLGGVRLNDEVGGVANLSLIPLWLIDRVEVYRGNAPLEASELGIGGAIFFEPRRPREDEFGAGVGAGSFGTASGFARASFGSDRHRALLGAEIVSSENDYAFASDGGTAFLSGDDSERRQRNADVSAFDAWLITRSNLDSATVDFLANQSRREQGVPRLALSPSLRARALLERGLYSIRARVPLGERDQHLLDLQTSLVSSSAQYDDPDSVLAFLAPTLHVVGRRAEQKLRSAWQLGKQLRLQGGIDATLERLRRRDGARLPSSHAAGSARAVLGMDFEVWRGLSLRALGAAECQSRNVSAAACAKLIPTGRVGLGFRTGPFTAFGNAGRYVRLPSLGELYGAAILVRGNERLRPELGATLDGGFRLQSSGKSSLQVAGDATAFVRWAEQLIGYVRSSQGYVVPENFEAARVAGLEMAVSADFEELVRAGLSLTLLDPRDTTPGRLRQNDVLPLQSRLVFVPTIGMKTPEIAPGVLDHARLDGEWLHRSNRYADAAGLVVLPGDDTVNLSSSLAWFSERLVTRARLENVFGAERFDVVGYPLPGRSFFASLELKWP